MREGGGSKGGGREGGRREGGRQGGRGGAKRESDCFFFLQGSRLILSRDTFTVVGHYVLAVATH
jgi:hypothetical protein